MRFSKQISKLFYVTSWEKIIQHKKPGVSILRTSIVNYYLINKRQGKN